MLSQFGGLPIREEEHYVDESLVDDQNVYARGSEANSIVDKPYVGQEFDNLNDVYNFYNCYALQKGFGVRKSSSSKSSATREVVWKKFVCDKAGWKKTIKEKGDGSEVVQRHRETKVGCTASLNVRWKNHGKWVVTVFLGCNLVEMHLRNPNLTHDSRLPQGNSRLPNAYCGQSTGQ
ncbi:FAR1 domain-containing protein [Cephalotus follicularis]|uniref:FAR1 domain-containing protein n=1 Tax=Cephalotus follicularis TaxID=3775 RepID=A0A1Q3CS06_CEPFO|nr:FAR1 domain-containing protein [Cephalotus follicularis]